MKAGRLGLLSVGLIFGLSACTDLLGGGGPTITSFTATPSSITAGSSSVLAWNVDASATSVSISGAPAITGDSGNVTVTPTETTEYTLTARSPEGTSTRAVTVTVVGGGTDTGGPGPVPGPDPDPNGLPTGTFGVSTSATGPFINDAEGGPIAGNDDPRIISVAPGGTFYAEVAYTDSDGIGDISLLLVNDEPAGLEGELPAGGFTVGDPTGTCDLGPSATSVTCVYPITVAAGTPDIEDLPDAGNEFAYVFRVDVTDAAGNAAGQSDRGYVNIQ